MTGLTGAPYHTAKFFFRIDSQGGVAPRKGRGERGENHDSVCDSIAFKQQEIFVGHSESRSRRTLRYEGFIRDSGDSSALQLRDSAAEPCRSHAPARRFYGRALPSKCRGNLLHTAR